MTQTLNRGRYLTVACCALVPFLQACGPLTVRDMQTGGWVPLDGAVLELHREVTIRGGRTRASFLNGNLVWHPSDFEPFCQLEVTTLAEHTRTVHPDTFLVTRVSGRKDEVVEAKPIMLAAGEGFALAWHGADYDSPSMVTQTIRFRLHSDRQPDVRGLICGGAFDYPGLADAPTLQEIDAALGDYATLVLNRP